MLIYAKYERVVMFTMSVSYFQNSRYGSKSKPNRGYTRKEHELKRIGFGPVC